MTTAAETPGLVLSGHTVHTAQSKAWDRLENGALLNATEEAGFDLVLTTDRPIRYQQNLKARRIALVVLTGSIRWSVVRQNAGRIAVAVSSAAPGSYVDVEIPYGNKTKSTAIAQRTRLATPLELP